MTDQLSENQSTPVLSRDDYEGIIAGYPLFSLLDRKDIRELADIAEEVKVKKGTIITKEGDIVDSVYLIVSGTADVTRTMTELGKTTVLDIATLKKGDAIGLTGTGYFANRGIRTATVISAEPMVLLYFNLQRFQRFLQKPGLDYPALKNTGDKILLMNFIQQSHLFKHISTERIQQIAKAIEKTSVKAGTIIYNENSIADECYFIVSGKVCVTTAEPNDRKEKIAKLYEPYSVFGETEYVTGDKRQGIARAETDCELLELERHNLFEVESTKPSMWEQFIHHINDFWKR